MGHSSRPVKETHFEKVDCLVDVRNGRFLLLGGGRARAQSALELLDLGLQGGCRVREMFRIRLLTDF